MASPSEASVSDQATHHWTMSTPSLRLFLMNKEQKVSIMEKFEE